MAGWPGRVRQHRPGRASDKRPRLVHSFTDRGTPVQIGCFIDRKSATRGAAGFGERSSYQEREWRGILFLRNPPALRDARATRHHRILIGSISTMNSTPAAGFSESCTDRQSC